MNIGNNLLLKSKQNLLESDSYNIGGSIGISGNSGGKTAGGAPEFVIPNMILPSNSIIKHITQ
jgi:hypothetical protein